MTPISNTVMLGQACDAMQAFAGRRDMQRGQIACCGIGQRRRAQQRKEIDLEGIPAHLAQAAYGHVHLSPRHVEAQDITNADAQRLRDAFFQRHLARPGVEPAAGDDDVAGR